jgi:rhodanese-related sulfurtransferase
MNFQDQKTSKEAYAELVETISRRQLVDVRSDGEWRASGVVDLSALQDRVTLCEWRKYPSMNINENFFEELIGKLDLNKIEALYFICAAGVRSQEALLHTRSKLEDLDAQIQCINISDGYEGNASWNVGFGKISGWKPSGLPWGEFRHLTISDDVEG